MILRGSKWSRDREVMLEAIRKDLERYETSRHLVIDKATILGGVNGHGDTLMPFWLEGRSSDTGRDFKCTGLSTCGKIFG